MNVLTKSMGNILRRIFNKIRSVIDRGKYKVELISLLNSLLKKNKGGKRFILFQTPSHTNIGDHAIAEAEIEFLKKSFPHVDIIEINQCYHFDVLPKLIGKLNTSDIIMLHGGGNLGNQYMHEEHIRRSVIEAFPNNKIIIFPQTIYYTNNEIGEKERKITLELFNKHLNLNLIAREQVSFDLMKSYFPKNKVIMTPDIVLSMDKSKPTEAREGVLMVLRNDDERTLTDEFRQQLDALANKFFKKITYSDMHYYKGSRTEGERREILDFKFKQFKQAKLVITDRLHGMVFAAITGIPCIAFSNYNQKVSGTYSWIQDLNYIRFVSTDVNIEKEINDLLFLKEKSQFSIEKYNKEFDQLISLIDD